MKAIFAISVFLFLSSLASDSTFAQVEKEGLQIGFIGGFTGPGKEYSLACRNGIELAIAELDANLDVRYEDDQSTASRTVSAYRKLVLTNRPDVIIVSGSTPANAVAPLAERDGMPLIAWAGDSAVSKGRPHVFRSWVSGVETGRAMAEEARNQQYDSVAWISSSDDYSNAVRDGFRLGFGSGLEVDAEVPMDLMDFRSILSRVKSHSIKQVAICLGAGQSAAISKQARELGMSPVFFGCETLYDSNEVRLAGGALEGAWLVTIDVQEGFRSKYYNRYGNDDLLGGAAVHYELVRRLALLEASDSIPLQLMKIKGSGTALCSLEAVNDQGDRHLRIGLVIKSVSDGAFVVQRHITSQCN